MRIHLRSDMTREQVAEIKADLVRRATDLGFESVEFSERFDRPAVGWGPRYTWTWRALRSGKTYSARAIGLGAEASCLSSFLDFLYKDKREADDTKPIGP